MASVSLWVDGTLSLDGRSVPIRQTASLLDALGEESSIQAAARRLALSYRAVWGRVAELEAALKTAVVSKTRGHGTALTPAGQALRHALRDSLDGLADALDREARSLTARLDEAMASRRRPWRLACSHDPDLMRVLEALPDVAVTVMGSQEALRRLAEGAVDGAGFHSPPGDEMSGEPDPAVYRVLPLLRREQGLMVAPGNPAGISGLADLLRPDILFVNRQRESGTRLWTDRLLRQEGIDPSRIRGYATEEFTHHAVAATVASGMAQAGTGVRSAAERFGLDFLPLAEETYHLAVRRDDRHPAIRALLDRMALDQRPG